MPNPTMPDTANGPATGLAVEGVEVRFGGIRALAGPTFRLHEGRVTALIGPNGAGKSTLVNVLTGLQRPTSGRVTLDGEDLTRSGPQAIARRGVLRTFQAPRVLAGLSVLENVMLADALNVPRGASRNLLSPKARRAQRASVERSWAVLERFSLARVAHNRGSDISGGQQRLVELARMSLRAPRYLILDEPTAGVAPAMRQTMVDHLRTLARETGATLVVIEHDMAVVEALADHVVVLAEGALLAEGGMAAVRTDQRVIDAYLGVELPQRRRSPGTVTATAMSTATSTATSKGSAR